MVTSVVCLTRLFLLFHFRHSRERPDGFQSENRTLQEQASGDQGFAVGQQPTCLGEKAVRPGRRAEQSVHEQTARAQIVETETIVGRQLFTQRHRTQKGSYSTTVVVI